MNKKKQFLIVLIAVLIFAIISQLLGSYLYIKFTPVMNESIGLTTLYSHYVMTNGAVLKLLWFKVGAGISVVLPLLVFIMFTIAIFKKPVRELHGSAKFATKVDLKQSNLLSPDKEIPDILIGQTKDGEYLRWASKAFAFLAAPTRLGKGVGIVIPNCLHYKDSLVVFDPKLENYKITSGYRKACGQEVYLFNPSTKNFKSHRWNPLSYVSRDPVYSTGDAFNIANILYSTSGGGEGNSRFFNEMAQKLFVGLVLYMIETEKASGIKPSLNQLVKLTTPGGGKDLKEWILEQVDPVEREYPVNLSAECANNLLSYTDNSDNTGSGIKASLVAPLSAFIEPVVAAVTSDDDFDLRDVRKKKMTIYVGINPNDFDKFKRLINLFFSQLISVNTEELPEDNAELKYQCLLLIDEFGAMGKVDVIQSGVAYIAGYNLRLLLIFQNLSQLNELYTVDGARTLSTNFDCQIIYPPRDNKDAQEYSEMIGYETVKSSSFNKSRGQMTNSSESVSDQRRALLLPQELTSMDDANCVISMRSMRPILGKKIIYYADPVFKRRLIYSPVPVPEIEVSQRKKDTEDPKEGANDTAFKFLVMNMLPSNLNVHDRTVFERSFDEGQQSSLEKLNSILGGMAA
ncbi:Protein VirD4 [Oligella ureolytica]